MKVGGFDGSPDAVAAIKAGELQYTVLQPVAVFSAEAVKQADSFIKTGKTGASSEKQLFDCLLITPDNVSKYTAPSPSRSEVRTGAAPLPRRPRRPPVASRPAASERACGGPFFAPPAFRCMGQRGARAHA